MPQEVYFFAMLVAMFSCAGIVATQAGWLTLVFIAALIVVAVGLFTGQLPLFGVKQKE